MSPVSLIAPTCPANEGLETFNAPRALVVGAGFGGLAAALRLRARGYDVEVVDRMDQPGGRAQVFREGGYIFDAGPTVLTAPFLFEELFALFDKKLSDYVEIVPVKPWYRFEFRDGRRFDYGGTVEETLAEIRRFRPEDADGYLRLLDHSRQIFEVGFEKLSDVPFDSFWFMLKQIPDLIRLRSYRTVYDLVASYIRDPHLRQAFSMQPLLVGGNPFQTTSIYSLIHYLERRWGVHFAMGGTGALVAAIARLMKEEGIRFRLGETVTEITVEQRRATGVRLANGEVLRADAVVVNGDPPFVHKHLIGAQHRRRWTDARVDGLKYSMGLFVAYFGTKRKFPDIAHHTIWMGHRYKELLRDIFDRKVLADDFSLYLHRPTATDPSLAPEGHDGFYVLSPVPNLQGGQDWNELRESYMTKILKALDGTIMPGLMDSLDVRFAMTPLEFRDRYQSLHGTGFSLAPVFTQSAWFRFHNRSSELDRLFLVGAGTHPGAGLPGVLCSAKILDKIVPEPATLRLR